MPENNVTVNTHTPSVAKGVDADLIDESVKYINEKANETLYKGSIEIGEYILKNFFNDDVALASSRNPRKPKSFKALCERKDLAVPYSTLTIMVRVAAQERFFKENRINVKKISYTHKAELIRIKNDETKIELVMQCCSDNLSTRQLNRLVGQIRKKKIAYRKHQRTESGFKNILKMEQLLNRSNKSELITDLSTIRSMKNRTREDLKNKTSELLEKLSQTARECRMILKHIDKVEKEKEPEAFDLVQSDE